MKDLVPHPYQAMMIGHVISTPRCALWAGMGMGKTSSTLAALDALLLAGSVTKALVLAPLRVARTTWPDEARKWTQFANLRLGFIEDWTEAEQAFLRALAAAVKLERRDEKRKNPATALAFSVADGLRPAAAASRLAWVKTLDVVTVNYDVLLQLVDILGEQWPFDMVIADESTRLKSFRLKQGGKRAQALSTVAHSKVKRWVNLTGTPSPNGLQDLWGQSWFIDRGQRLGRTYDAFENRWFGFQRAKDAVNAHKTYVKRIVFPHAQAEMQGALKDVCLTLDPKDWFNLDEPIVNTLYVDLPPQARKHYRDMEKEMFTVLEQTHEVEAFGAAAKSIKCLQIASGAAYVGESNTEWVVLHDEKIEALRSVVEESAGSPVLVAYHFKSDLSRLRHAFPAARVLDADSRTIADWNQGEIPVLLAHPASAGHGLNLADGGNILVFFSHWWALEERQQILERIGPVRQKQAGYNRPVFVHQIVARDTVDEMVLERIATKREVQDILMEALKRRKDDSG